MKDQVIYDSIFSFCLLVVGVFLFVFIEKISGLIFIAIRRNSFGDDKSKSFLSKNQNEGNFFVGVLWACVVGILGNSILVPIHYVSKLEILTSAREGRWLWEQ